MIFKFRKAITECELWDLRFKEYPFALINKRYGNGCT